jgi:hypothetical protein
VNLLLRLLPRPGRERFARSAVEALVASGVPRDAISYDPEHYEIEVEDNRWYLDGAYRQACLAWPWQRRGIVRRLAAVHLQSRRAEEPSLDAVRDRLLPGVRHTWGLGFVALKARTEGREPLDVPGLPLGPWLRASVFVDHEQSTALVTAPDLERWGLSFEQALALASENLKARSTAPLTALAEGLYHSPWQDFYDPSRLLLPELLAPLDLRGDPVVALPSPNHLLVTGADDPAGIAAAIAFGLEVQEEEAKTISAVPLVRRGGEWVGLELPRGHPAEPLLRKARVVELSGVYAEQKALLDKLHDRDGIDVYVAEYTGSRNETTDEHTSYCVWSRGVPSLLPATEEVVFFDPARPEPQGPLARVDWDIAQFHCGGMMRRTDDALARFRVDAFPSDEAIAAMARSQAQRAGAG